MNVEYLKKFKEELEKENKYCLIEELSETNIKNTNKIFSLNGAYTGTESSDLGEFGYKIDYNDKISGVVNLEEFILKMKALGFDIEFANYYGGISFQDYINSIKENGLDTFISITANFSKSNENNYRI